MYPKTANIDNSRSFDSREQGLFSPDNIRQCELNVLKIQHQLDKAVENDDTKRIRFLVHQLSAKSLSTRIMSIYRICYLNNGKYTAGVDGVSTPRTRAERLEFMNDILYNIDINKKPEPIRRVFIPKPNGKQRPLGIPTIHDRITQDIIKQSIEPICEYHFNHCSHGFRPKRSCHDAIADIFIKLSRKTSKKWVIEGDIKGCFDFISHDHIIEMLKQWKVPNQVRDIILQMLKSNISFDEKLSPSEAGTPQGGVISPMLANVALTSLDNAVEEWHNWESNPIVRYADDFIITAWSHDEAVEIRNKVKSFIKNTIGLELSDEKTRITHIDEGFDFLGFSIRKYNETLHIKPASDNIKEYRHKIRLITKDYNADPYSLIKQLNPIIIGWGNYYSNVVSSHIFSLNTTYLFRRLWKWAVRKHPNYGRKKIRWEYFNNEWTFFDKITQLKVIQMQQIPIRRHIKVKANMRVYNKEHQEYWSKRENQQMGLYGVYRQLYDKQKGFCSFCNGRITSSDKDLHIHHLKPISYGGDDKLNNLRLIHHDCHSEIHSTFSLEQMSKYVDNGIDYITLLKAS